MSQAISNWYTSQYANWNRTRRLSVPPYVATENNVHTPTTVAADALILNVNDGNSLSSPGQAPPKKADTLFGPGVGVITSGPDWTEPSAPPQDELTPEIVKSWIAKSKEATNPTTTLQALVNLKRPSIKLSPLAYTGDTPDIEHRNQHGLEFEFDCDAPKCGIKVHVLGASDDAKMTAFDAVVDGGFGRTLKYDEGAVLELHHPDGKIGPAESSLPQDSDAKAAAPDDATPHDGHLAAAETNGQGTRNRRRFSHFGFRKRNDSTVQRVAGPALRVVDADAEPVDSSAPTMGKEASSDHEKGKDEDGLKVTIQLEALDEHSHPLNNTNSQQTFLHIVQMGNPPDAEDQDRRPWVVKVVRREAIIGPHVFHLHEIYGLSSASAVPTITEDSTPHAYPPPAQAEEQTSECLLCLSSPREVVLLPCRHLVACRECAVNMVEFGAGGTLVHSESDPTGAAAGDIAAEGDVPTDATQNSSNQNGNGNSATPAAVATPAPQRRKRKAKGWFCPVCRQPYTSLLRITTNPPEKDSARTSSSEENAAPATEQPAMPPAAVTAAHTNHSLDMRSLFPRPAFLRSLSRSNNRPAPTGANMV